MRDRERGLGIKVGDGGVGLKQIAVVLGLVFAVALAVVVGKQMSAEAMAVVVGVVCGVAAAIGSGRKSKNAGGASTAIRRWWSSREARPRRCRRDPRGGTGLHHSPDRHPSASSTSSAVMNCSWTTASTGNPEGPASLESRRARESLKGVTSTGSLDS